MRQSLLITFLVVALSANAQSDWQKISWLLGKWERTQMKPGKSGVEIWEKVKTNEWRGRGISLNGTDTSFVEKLKVVEENGQLFYVSDVPENAKPVYFKITAASDSYFACENPQHDFPKKIEYRLQGTNGLKATISGNGQSMDFYFIRKE